MRKILTAIVIMASCTASAQDKKNADTEKHYFGTVTHNT